MAEVTLENLKSSNQETLSLNSLGEQIKNELNETCKSASGWIKVFIGWRTQNGPRTDNDIVVIGDLRNFKIKLFSEVFIINTFGAVIECKGHSNEFEQRVRITANNVEVKYPNKRTGESYWCNASAQAAECAISVRQEMRYRTFINLFVNDFVWLYNLNSEFKDNENIFGAKFSAYKFFKKIVSDARNLKVGTERSLIKNNLGNIYRATKDSHATNLNFKLLNYVKTLSADFLDKDLGGLTRINVEKITKNKVDKSKYYADIGNKMIIFDGGPGTGKTQSLLYCAKNLYDAGHSILLLTYNNVLRCDLQRLLEYAKMGGVSDNGVFIKSSTGFFISLLKETSLMTPPTKDNYGEIFKVDEETNKSPYEQALETLFELIKEKPLHENIDLDNQISPEINFDYIMIDESQDWLPIERDIIIELWTGKKIILAQSQEQLTRGAIQATDWTRYLKKEFIKLPRRKSLRQGKVLVNFNKVFLDELNYQSSSLEEEPDMGGGKIIICEGPYSPKIHKLIFENHLKGSEKKYDFSFACHGNMGTTTAGFNEKQKFFREGIPIWDACKEETRRFNQIGEDLHRMMFYESTRGIEAWTFVCLEYDFWLEEMVTSRAQREYKESIKQLDLNIFDEGGLDPEEKAISKITARWAMIPLTRAISTNVIQIRSRESKYGKLIFSALKKIPNENYEILFSK